MDVAWTNIQYDKDNDKLYDSKSDNSIERISIGSETIKIYYNQESERKETYVKIILINNIAGYEYPIVRGRGI
ncbi:MAG: hypothetical protein NKF70_01775 [Methanobacterium sp. ERen5]|nr:MAG: hypothetical protein NKF70_01775 [Methanobacterium sp. ERen5]